MKHVVKLPEKDGLLQSKFIRDQVNDILEVVYDDQQTKHYNKNKTSIEIKALSVLYLILLLKPLNG